MVDDVNTGAKLAFCKCHNVFKEDGEVKDSPDLWVGTES